MMEPTTKQPGTQGAGTADPGIVIRDGLGSGGKFPDTQSGVAPHAELALYEIWSPDGMGVPNQIIPLAKEPILSIPGIFKRPIVLVCLLAVLSAGTMQCDPPPPVGNPVRTIDIAALDRLMGNPDFNGLVVIMAAWCRPCREELPDLAELYAAYRDRGIRIVAVGIDSGGPREIQPLVDELKIPFPVYWAGPAATQHYRIAGIPTIMTIRGGRRLETIPGRHPRRFIEKKIEDLLERSTGVGTQ